MFCLQWVLPFFSITELLQERLLTTPWAHLHIQLILKYSLHSSSLRRYKLVPGTMQCKPLINSTNTNVYIFGYQYQTTNIGRCEINHFYVCLFYHGAHWNVVFARRGFKTSPLYGQHTSDFTHPALNGNQRIRKKKKKGNILFEFDSINSVLSSHFGDLSCSFDRLCCLVVRVLRYRSPGFDSPHYQNFWEVAGLELGPLSLVRIAEGLLERKSSGSVLENRD
jgi:hypothetical protein